MKYKIFALTHGWLLDMTLKKYFGALVLFLLFMVICSCGGAGGDNADASTPSSVKTPVATLSSMSITPTNAKINKGTTRQFTATGLYSDNTIKDITSEVSWNSLQSQVASIDTSGRVTAKATGVATITALSGNISGSTSVTVPPATLVSIAVTPLNVILLSGATQQFKAIATYSDGSTADVTSAVTWNSANLNIATVNTTNGRASAVAKGSTTISASYFGTITGTVGLTVTSAVIESILEIKPLNPSIPQGTTQQFSAIGTFSDNTQGDITSSVTWSSSNTSVATINDGLATGVAPGSATISASSGSSSKETTLTVTSVTLSSILVTPSNPEIPKNTVQQFKAIGTYSDASSRDITSEVAWSSQNESIATINSAGQATGIAGGQTVIKATSGTKSGSATLIVLTPSLASILVTPNNSSMLKGSTQQFTATGIYSDETTKDVTSLVSWSSSNTAVATITSTGLATAIANGSNIIIKATYGNISGSTTLSVTRCAGASPTWTADPDYESVSACVSKALPGDTINVKAGSADWAANTLIINKSINLIGAGNDKTLIVNSAAAPLINISLSSDVAVRISCFYFTQATNDTGYTTIQVKGKTDGSFAYTKIRIDGNKIEKGSRTVQVSGWVEGLIDNNTFMNCNICIGITGDNHHSWGRPIQAGTANALFIENNTFITDNNADREPNQPIYHQEGARTVTRYNTFDGSAYTNGNAIPYDSHGNWGTNLLDYRGQPILEVYNNVFKAHHTYQITDFRGGSILFYNNDFYTISGAPTRIIELWEEEAWTSGGPFCSVPCPVSTTWPAEDQIFNSFFWNNRTFFNGASAPTIITDVQLRSNDVENTFIKKDRDYFMHVPQASGGKEILSNAGAPYYARTRHMTFSSLGANAYYPYSPYKCPHPLSGLEEPCNANILGTNGYSSD